MIDDGVRGQDELITSPANPTIKLARSLHRKRVRQRERALLVEGSRAILAAADLGVRIRSLIIDASRASDIDASVVSRLRAASERVVFVDPKLYQLITDTEHPQPLAAICDMVEADLPPDSTLVVVLDGVRDPGNLGTLIRSCAAAGVDGIALLHGSVDPYNPKAVRASVGSIFAVPVRSFARIDDVVTTCFLQRPRIVVAESESEAAYDEVDWTVPSILVVGGEAEGASAASRTYADLSVRIPMAPGIESLNAAVAGSIIVFEVARQRRVDH